MFRISSLNYSMYHAMLIPPIRTFLKTIRFAISARGPLLQNNCLSKEEKEIDNFLLFKKRAKEKIMELSTATNFLSKKILFFQTVCVNKVNAFENCSLILSCKIQVSNINDECVVNASEATPRGAPFQECFWAYAANLRGGTHDVV